MEVIYERDTNVGNGFQAYRGRAQTTDEVKEFDGFHFEALLRLLAKMLQPSDLGITFIRSDRPELQPYPLESELVELIRDNVEEAIVRMSHPDVRIVVGRPLAPPDVIKSGGDTMAGAFGDEVLLRLRKMETPVTLNDKGVSVHVDDVVWTRVECPVCGAWQGITISVTNGVDFSMECEHCGVKLPLRALNEEWATVQVSDLLGTDREKFFLPRAWNNYQPWIFRESLESIYADFQKLKEQFNVR